MKRANVPQSCSVPAQYQLSDLAHVMMSIIIIPSHPSLAANLSMTSRLKFQYSGISQVKFLITSSYWKSFPASLEHIGQYSVDSWYKFPDPQLNKPDLLLLKLKACLGAELVTDLHVEVDCLASLLISTALILFILYPALQ